MPLPPHQKSLRAGRWSEQFGCYAITKCVELRRRVLDCPESAQLILDGLKFRRERSQIRVIGFCIMPDHYHLLAFFIADITLPTFMEALGKFTALRLNRQRGWSGKFWQEGYYDHRCRNADDIEDRLIYFEHNPVRAGLVAKAEDWPYSSANASNALYLDRDWYASVM